MSSGISFTCDSCGREVYGCNIVNGMKFCAKCYQETFGETDKDKQVAELKKQLERHNKYFNSFNCDNFDEFTDFISTFMLTPHEEQTLIKDLKKATGRKEKEIEDLKRKVNCYVDYVKNTDMRIKLDSFMVKELQDKLQSQPAEIVEKIKEQIFNHFNVKNIEEYERLPLLNALLTADAVIEILDAILEEYQK